MEKMQLFGTLKPWLEHCHAITKSQLLLIIIVAKIELGQQKLILVITFFRKSNLMKVFACCTKCKDNCFLL